jgi:hypothetical protein
VTDAPTVRRGAISESPSREGDTQLAQEGADTARERKSARERDTRRERGRERREQRAESRERESGSELRHSSGTVVLLC